MTLGDKFVEKFLYLVLFSMLLLNSDKFIKLLDSSFKLKKEETTNKTNSNTNKPSLPLVSV